MEKPTRPKTPPRIQLSPDIRPFYFITFNTNGRQKILANESIHEAFKTYSIKGHNDYSVSVGRYVIMPDHIHFFVYMPERGIQLGRWIQGLKSTVGKKFSTQEVDYPYWQRGFFDHVMRSSESYTAKWSYVAQNPVRAGLCRKVEEWPYQGEIIRLSF